MGSSSSKAIAAFGRGGVSRKFPSRALGAAVPPRRAQQARASPAQSDHVTDQGEAEQNSRHTKHGNWTLKAAPSEQTQVLEIHADAADAADLASGDFSQRLHSMGMVQPSPTFPSSARATRSPSHSASQASVFPTAPSNATLSVLAARRLVEQQADEDSEKIGRRESTGRRFLDMRTLVDAVEMRDRGASNSDIERSFKLRPGIMNKLGPPSILSHLSMR